MGFGIIICRVACKHKRIPLQRLRVDTALGRGRRDSRPRILFVENFGATDRPALQDSLNRSQEGKT